MREEALLAAGPAGSPPSRPADNCANLVVIERRSRFDAGRPQKGTMLPTFLLEESLQRQDGSSAVLELDRSQVQALALTLGITRIIEQESLEVGFYLSKDGENWDAKPVLSFPQKFYCGTYSLLLDLSPFAEARFLKAEWKMNRWGRGDPTPLFAFYIFAEAAEDAALATAV